MYREQCRACEGYGGGTSHQQSHPQQFWKACSPCRGTGWVDCPSLSSELDRLRQLETLVKGILSQANDDHCWMDWGRLYPEMAALVGLDDWKPRVLDRETMLGNCPHFVDCLLKGDHYVTPSVPREEYEKVVTFLRRLEWVGESTNFEGDSWDCCPLCRAESYPYGLHKPDCDLAALLKETKT